MIYVCIYVSSSSFCTQQNCSHKFTFTKAKCSIVFDSSSNLLTALHSHVCVYLGLLSAIVISIKYLWIPLRLKSKSKTKKMNIIIIKQKTKQNKNLWMYVCYLVYIILKNTFNVWKLNWIHKLFGPKIIFHHNPCSWYISTYVMFL